MDRGVFNKRARSGHDTRTTHCQPLPFTLDLTFSVAKGVTEIINTYNATCGQEPIMLVGYSRGGATVQSMAWTTWMAQPEVEIDLVVTIAPVCAARHAPTQVR